MIDVIVLYCVFVSGFLAGWVTRVYLSRAQQGVREL